MDGKIEIPLKVNLWSVVKRFLTIFLPLAALMGAIIMVVYYTEAKGEKTIIETNETHHIAVLPESIISDFRSVVSDLMFLSEQHELQRMFESIESLPVQVNLTQIGDYQRDLADNFLKFSKRKRLYDQIRFLNETGMEVVRVNFNNGKPYIVPEEQLQFKGKRYYFEDTFQLEQGEVFVSPFDLNIEQGKIEQPLKPMIRFGTPVFDSHGKKRGIVLLNYLGAKLIHNLEMARGDRPGQMMLLNSDGFWLKGPKPEDEWGFMFASRSEDVNRTFGNAFPDAWQSISGAESGQFYTADGLFTFETVYTLAEAQKSSTGSGKAFEPSAARLEGKKYYWKIVSHISPDILNARAHRVLSELLLLYAVLVVVLMIGSWFLSRASVARNIAKEEIQRSLQLNATLLDSIPHPALLIRSDRTVIAANKIAFEMGAKVGEPCWREFHKSQFVHDGENKCWFCMADEARDENEGKHCDVEAFERLWDTWWVPVGEDVYLHYAIDITKLKRLQEREREAVAATAAARMAIDTIEAIGDGVVLLSMDRKVISVNPALEEMGGYTKSELAGKDAAELIQKMIKPGDAEKILGLLGTMEGKVPTPIPATGVSKDGREVPIVFSVSFIKDSEGKPTAIVVTIKDITELKQVENKLRKSEASLIEAQRIAHIGNWDWDIINNELRWSDEIYRIFGLSPQEFDATYEAFLASVHPDDRELVKESVNKALSENKPYSIDHRIVLPDGSERIVHEQAEVVFDETGRPIRMIGTVQDITKRNRAKEALQLNESRLAALVEMNQMTETSLKDIADFVLNEGIRLTKSKIGFLKFLNDDETDMTIHAWSKTAVEQCAVIDKPIHFPIEKAGLWGEAVRQRKPILINDYSSTHIHKKGYPKGHVELMRFMATPVFDRNQIVAVAGMANKEEEYNTSDVRQLTLLMDGMWRITQRKRTEQELQKAHDELELRVEERTAELAGANEQLQQEIAERSRSVETLHHTLEILQQRQEEISALLEGSSAVLEYREFQDAARAIFDSCKNLIGATAGYVALLSADGAENEVLFLDSGGLPCTVDPLLPMPIRGLREIAYRTGKVVYDNNFAKSKWMRFMPKGHVSLDNVLFAPLPIGGKEGKVVGALGLANKPGGFTENDARIASAFGELALIALINSRTLESLENSEERFRSVALSANDAIVSADSSGNIVFWNKSAQTIFGYGEEEVLGKSVSLLIPERYKDAHRRGLERLRLTGESHIIGKTVESHGMRKDGSEFPIELSLATWNTREGTFYSSIIRDITERKRAGEELKAAQEYGRNLIDSSLDIIISVDRERRIVEFNRAAQKAFGYSKEEVLGKYINILYADCAVGLKVHKATRLSSQFSGEILNKRKNGELFPCFLSASVLQDANGEFLGVMGISRDITERKRMEEQLRMAKEAAEASNRAKSEFLANMSHELRTPLNAIIGFSEILSDQIFGELNQRQARYANNILTSGRHLLALINDILDLSKVESGKMELELSLVNIKRLLENSMVMIKEKAMKHGISLDLRIRDELANLEIQADEIKLKQIIFNILSNATKFTQDGGAITVEARREGVELAVSVSDTGIGIKAEDQERIFGEFVQVDSSYAREHQGTGLGLALTRRLVELHGGRIWVESEGEGKGSTFTFVIPIEAQERKETPAQ